MARYNNMQKLDREKALLLDNKDFKTDRRDLCRVLCT